MILIIWPFLDLRKKQILSMFLNAKETELEFN